MDTSTPSTTPLPSTSYTPHRLRNRNLQKFLQKPFLLPILIAIILVIGIIIMMLRRFDGTTSKSVIGSSDPRVAIAPPKSEHKLNKTFSFPLRDSAGKEVSKVKYAIESAEMRDELVIKGQRNIAVKGRQFLVVNIKFTNDYDKAIEVTSRDYIRLIINDSTEKTAADVHNDPIQVQPISTKVTRLAFPIDDKAQNLKLQVGEINGKKEIIILNLK